MAKTALEIVNNLIKSGVPWWGILLMISFTAICLIPALFSFYTAYKIYKSKCIGQNKHCAEIIMQSPNFVALEHIKPIQEEIKRISEKINEMKQAGNKNDDHLQDLSRLLARLQGSLDVILSQGGNS